MPKPLVIKINSSEYYMETKLRKANPDEIPCWYLCHHGKEIGRINIHGNWTSRPSVSAHIRKEAENLTNIYNTAICECYKR